MNTDAVIELGLRTAVRARKADKHTGAVASKGKHFAPATIPPRSGRL